MFGKKNNKHQLLFDKKQRHTDAEYIRALQGSGNDRIQEDFYIDCRHYFYSRKGGVFDYSSSHTVEADDLFQDSFLKLWEEIHSRKISLRDNYPCRTDRNGEDRRMTASLMTYLMAIAKFKNYENVREESKYVDELVSAPEVLDTDPEEFTAEEIVRQCVTALPPRCKEILTLFYYEGKSLDEILLMRQENQSKDGLKSGKSKCMAQLKKKILDEFKRHNLKPYAHA